MDNEYLYENNTEVYRQKFPDLHKAEQDLTKNEKEYEKRIEMSNNNLQASIEELENSKPSFFTLKNLFIVYFFKSRRLNKQIEKLEENIKEERSPNKKWSHFPAWAKQLLGSYQTV